MSSGPQPPGFFAQENSSATPTFDIDFLLLVRRVWTGRIVLFVCVAFGLIAALIALHVMTPRYRSEMLVTPSVTLVSNGQGTGSGALSGLIAAASGSATSDVSALPFTRFNALFLSEEVVARVDARHHLSQILFAGRWDSATHSWRTSDSVMSWVVNFVRALAGLAPHTAPDNSDLAKAVGRMVSIEERNQSSIYTITAIADSPELARNLLVWLYAETDGVIREQTMARTKVNVDYLVNLLRQVTDTQQRAILTDLLQVQERTLMLLNTGPFSAEIIAAPQVPERPDSLLLFALGFGVAGGLAVGLAGAWLLGWAREGREGQGHATGMLRWLGLGARKAHFPSFPEA